MAESNGANRSPLRSIILLMLVVILPLAVGLYAAPRLVPKPQVGIIRLSLDIFGGTTYEITEQLAYAREHDEVQAVVLIINSPGGSAAFSEELYLDVLNTRAAGLPVIANIDLLAASGAYYMAAAADEIYAKPTSSVGSVGVISSLPTEVFIEEDLLTTGPYKAFGGTRDGFMRQMERAKFAFLKAVEIGRAGRLVIDLDTLSRAEIFTGVEAAEYGLIDGLIAQDEAIQRAADLAGLSNYEVVELFPLVFEDAGSNVFFEYQPQEVDVEALWAAPIDLPPGIYYRYVAVPGNQ